jgi:alpha-galactosidase
VIDVNQDPLGIQAAPIWHGDGGEVIYMKHLWDGSVALGMFNRGEKPAEMSFTLDMLGMRGTRTVRDLWRQKDVATLDGKAAYTTSVAPHGVAMVRVWPGNPDKNL